MKKIYLVVLCATAIGFCAGTMINHHDYTMPPPPREHKMKDFAKHHAKMEQKIADELKLTPEQREQAKKMREDTREKIKPLIDEMKNVREKIDNLRKANMEEFEKLLTPEQKTQFEKIKEHRRAHFKKRHHKKMPPLPME